MEPINAADPAIARSELHVYRGGHLDLIAEPHRLAPVIERFLRPG